MSVENLNLKSLLIPKYVCRRVIDSYAESFWREIVIGGRGAVGAPKSKPKSNA
jgi:hypothetical protein